MSLEFPEKIESTSEIERQFRHELGAINPYLCLVDVSTKFFIEQANVAPDQEELTLDQKKFIKKATHQFGYQKLYTDHLNISDMQNFVHLTHIAWINAKAEVACNKIQNISVMLKEAKNIAQGDFLRRTIAIMHASNKDNVGMAKNIPPEIYENYIGCEELKTLDYFRRLRNICFHSSGVVDSNILVEEYQNINRKYLKTEYKVEIHSPNKTNSKDVLLLSLIWQVVMKKICRESIDTRKLYNYLQNAYKGISNRERREKKIRQSLKLNFLKTDEDIRYNTGASIY